MNLSEYLTDLSYKELSNLSLSDSGSGTIKDDKIPFVVSCINDALLRLYTKFILKEKSFILELKDWIGEYKLESKYAYSTGLDSNKYIMDGSDPFIDDLIKILDVYDAYGKKIPINNTSNSLSIFTPKVNVIQVPNIDLYGRLLSINYQARHPILDYSLNPQQEIELPDSLLAALSSYVAYSIYNTMNTKEASEAAQKYLQTYVALVQETIETDAVNSSISQNNSRFFLNGWC